MQARIVDGFQPWKEFLWHQGSKDPWITRPSSLLGRQAAHFSRRHLPDDLNHFSDGDPAMRMNPRPSHNMTLCGRPMAIFCAVKERQHGAGPGG
jgi:hypothetical protein